MDTRLEAEAGRGRWSRKRRFDSCRGRMNEIEHITRQARREIPAMVGMTFGLAWALLVALVTYPFVRKEW